MKSAVAEDELFMSLLEAAARLAAQERESFLAEACRDHPDLAAEVLERAAWLDRMGDFLAEPLTLGNEPDAPFAPQALLAGRFRLARVIGEGGMAVVYEGFDEKLQQPCAIKCAKPGFGGRLPPEARNAFRVTHENVCRVFGFYTAESDRGPLDFLSMEYIEGPTLAEVLLERGKLPEEEALAIARQLSAGLGAAHAKGVLHRDLKTNNVMIARGAGERLRAVIMDFGLAAEPARQAAPGGMSGVLGGALDYMAPELLNHGSPSVQSDIYALGVMLYEMVAGRLPLEGSSHIGAEPEPPGKWTPGLRRRWNTTILRCLATNPKERFGSAEDVASALTGSRLRHVSWAASIALAASLGVMWPAARNTIVDAFKPEPPPTVFAILPFQSIGSDPDVERLIVSGLRELTGELEPLKLRNSRLILIPIEKALRDGVRRPEHAAQQLGATHAMHGEVRREGGKLAIAGGIYDAASLHRIREFSAAYEPSDIPRLPRALAGMAAAALHAVPAPRATEAATEGKRAYDRGIAIVRRSLEGTDSAIAEFEAGRKGAPESAYPLAGLTEAYCSKYQLTQNEQWLQRARDALGQAELRDADSTPVRLASARLNRLQAMYERAIGDYVRVTELEPGNAQAHVGLALTYQFTGRSRDAIEAFGKAIDLKPDYFVAHLELGHLHHRQGRHEQAEKHLVKAAEIEPSSSKAHSSLGALYVDMARYDEAEAELRRSIQLEKSDAALIDLGAALALKGRDREAIQYYEEALAAGAVTPEALVNLGDSYRRTRALRRAEDAYRRGLAAAHRALEADPNDGSSRAYAGYLGARLGDRITAERESAQALQLLPADAKIRRRRILTLECLGLREKALELLEDAPPGMLREIDAHPDLADLRSDQRYRQLISTRKGN